ncbi:methyltransferase domain-containing protein [candidate division KSB3 bacterium]|uniref:Methyltransferase domain-containing protein n=1 Tax=candidate division KSB3 bacterium TaxID=2044937 RepID=A0A9D5Q4D5_9BACT|nr:methyltransferase domain-containing protein [candidate division KSB3 bacterium]MBD3323445.1 methyltransferase domain-containing protein [candidate division KSB3 bacterium]
MTIHVNKDWWQDLFDDVYLQTDARSVCDAELTAREVDFLEKVLELQPSTSILDLCGGQGRHSLELCRRGFQNVTVLDYSQYLIDLGTATAQQEGLKTKFLQGDARHTGLPAQSVEVIIVMASSFGYCADEHENQQILDEAFRLLKPQGTLLLDLPDREYILQHFKSFSQHQINDDLNVTRHRELREDLIACREIVTSQKHGCIRDGTYCIRLYSPETISAMLRAAGFAAIRFVKDFMRRDADGDYGTMTNRMVVTAEKG